MTTLLSSQESFFGMVCRQEQKQIRELLFIQLKKKKTILTKKKAQWAPSKPTFYYNILHYIYAQPRSPEITSVLHIQVERLISKSRAYWFLHFYKLIFFFIISIIYSRWVVTWLFLIQKIWTESGNMIIFDTNIQTYFKSPIY